MKKDPFVDKYDILMIAIVPIGITVAFGNKAKEMFGNNYDIALYLFLLVNVVLLVMYISIKVCQVRLYIIDELIKIYKSFQEVDNVMEMLYNRGNKDDNKLHK